MIPYLKGGPALLRAPLASTVAWWSPCTHTHAHAHAHGRKAEAAGMVGEGGTSSFVVPHSQLPAPPPCPACCLHAAVAQIEPQSTSPAAGTRNTPLHVRGGAGTQAMLAIMTHSFVVVVLCKLVGNTSEGFPGLHDT